MHAIITPQGFVGRIVQSCIPLASFDAIPPLERWFRLNEFGRGQIRNLVIFLCVNQVINYTHCINSESHLAGENQSLAAAFELELPLEIIE
jgi:hypothetical protein